MTLRDWLFGPPRTDTELRLGLPPCGHRGSTIAPAMEDPDQRIICCHCGRRLSEAEVGMRHLREATERVGFTCSDFSSLGAPARETEDERRQRRVDEFEELKAWADSLPELVLRLRPGEAHFAAVYEPLAPFGERSASHYGMTVPVDRVMEASGDLPEEEMDRFVEEFGRYVTVRPGGGVLRNGMPNPIPFDAVHLKGKFRPEVFTLTQGNHAYGSSKMNGHEELDRLVKARERLRARNLPEGRLFTDSALVVHVKVSCWWTMHGQSRPRYSHMDRKGMALAPVKVGIVL